MHILFNKLQKILYRSRIDPCKKFQGNMKSLDMKIDNFYQNPAYLRGEVIRSLQFNPNSKCTYYNTKDTIAEQYTQSKNDKILVNNTLNEVDYVKEKDYIIEQIIKELSLNEIELICNNLEFFVKDKFVRDMLGLIDETDNKLYLTLDKEMTENRVLSKKERIKEMLIRKKNEIIKKRNLKNEKKILTPNGYIDDDEEIKKYQHKKIDEKLLKNRINRTKKLKILQNQKTLNIHQTINKMIMQSQKDVMNINKKIKDSKINHFNNQKSLMERHSKSIFLKNNSYHNKSKFNNDISTLNKTNTNSTNFGMTMANATCNNANATTADNNTYTISTYGHSNNKRRIISYSPIDNFLNKQRNRMKYRSELQIKQMKEANVAFLIQKYTKEIRGILQKNMEKETNDDINNNNRIEDEFDVESNNHFKELKLIHIEESPSKAVSFKDTSKIYKYV